MTLSILCVGAWLVMTRNDFSIGMLVAFQMFAGRLSQPLLHLVGLWQQAGIAVKRLVDVMDPPLSRARSFPPGNPVARVAQTVVCPHLLPIYSIYSKTHMEPETIEQIRQATNGNYALGSRRFAQEVEAALGRRAVRGQADRPAAKAVDLPGQEKLF